MGRRTVRRGSRSTSRTWPAPALVSPVRGSALEKDIFRTGCNAFARPPGLADAGYEVSGRNNLGLNSDGLLYLGPRSSLLFGPRDPDIYMDMEYRAEMDRRMLLRTGEHLTGAGGNPSVPKPFW